MYNLSESKQHRNFNRKLIDAIKKVNVSIKPSPVLSSYFFPSVANTSNYMALCVKSFQSFDITNDYPIKLFENPQTTNHFNISKGLCYDFDICSVRDFCFHITL